MVLLRSGTECIVAFHQLVTAGPARLDAAIFPFILHSGGILRGIRMNSVHQQRAVGARRGYLSFGIRRSAMIVGTIFLITGVGGVANAGQATAAVPGAPSFDVEFTDCSELASITTITVAKARTVVPASFTLAGDASGAPFVVRVAHCRAVSVDGSAPEAAT